MRRLPALLLVAFFPIASSAGVRSVDFRFAPSNSFSLISFPEDWLKSVVTRAGALGYDFGPGPYARPLTTIGIEAEEESLAVERQWLPEGRVPIVRTRLRGDAITSEQVVFATIPEQRHSATHVTQGRVSRLGGRNGCRAWANPLLPCDPLFRSVAWGTNRPILYRITVPPGSGARVALGFCEQYKPRPRTRLLDCRVEGDAARIVDPLESGVPRTPHVEFFDGIDTNRDGQLAVEIHPVQGSDPNVILNALWLFPDSANVTASQVISGEASPRASLAYACGLENEESPARQDALIASFSGPSATPVLRIRTRLSLSLDQETILADGRPFLICRPAPDSLIQDAQGWKAPLPRGTSRVEVIALHGNTGAPLTARRLAREQERAARWWRNHFPRPILSVGDSMIQFLLEANLRNLYQAADRVDGFLQLQPGPSVYRGLWVGDVILSALPALMAGDTLTPRLMLETVLRYQRPTGQIRVIVPTDLLAETPMVVTAMTWYARTANDTAWLRSHWPNLRDALAWILSMRERTLRDERAPYRGLMPPGFVDGGISNLTADYGTAFWSLIALERSEEAARQLGYAAEADTWQNSAAELRASLDAAIRRDARADASGNLYLPVAVGDTTAAPPERGQFASLLPLRYGRFLQQRTSFLDTIVRGTLRMLDATCVEGIIANSGWLPRGLWPWLGAAHGIAWQMMDDREKAIDFLYAVANHASEPGTWVEEQLPRNLGTTWTGDASNAEASGLFIHLVRNALLLERLDTLHCLASVPAEWLRNGSRNEVRNAPTLFGRITCSLTIARDGRSAELAWQASRLHDCAAVILHTTALREAGFRSTENLPERIALHPEKPLRLRFIRP